jgi:hypothetical protein
MIHVDTNVILDIMRPNAGFAQRSAAALAKSAQKVIGPLVYAELASGADDHPALDAALVALGITVATMNTLALFAAGQAFRAYRRRGGPRESILPDFLVGAHAFTDGCPLLTRDPTRYRTAYPKLELVEP